MVMGDGCWVGGGGGGGDLSKYVNGAVCLGLLVSIATQMLFLDRMVSLLTSVNKLV